MSNSVKPLQIDIVSDIVCPWCVVGYRQLAEALKATNTEHEIHWHPYQLNPDMPPEGQNMGEHLAEKYGISAEQSKENRQRITAAGAELGFKFNFTEDLRMHNTFNAHQLLHWAGQKGLQNELKQAFFAAHFTDNLNLADSEVLVAIAADVGLDKTEALAIIEEQRFAKEVSEAENTSRQQGVQGVPAIIFNQKHLVSGAQGVENFKQILEQLADM